MCRGSSNEGLYVVDFLLESTRHPFEFLEFNLKVTCAREHVSLCVVHHPQLSFH